MNAFAFFCQVNTCASILTNAYKYVQYTANLTTVTVQFFSCGIWNFDFFWYFIPLFCDSSDMSTLHTLALLLPFIHFCWQWFTSDVWSWSLGAGLCLETISCVLSNPKGSAINDFATFLLLSYEKHKPNEMAIICSSFIA